MEQQLTTEPASVLVHPVLTSVQAEYVHQALIVYLNSPAGHIASDPEEEASIKKAVSELTYFFDSVVAHPDQFPLRSVEDTKRIARAHKAAVKGPAQPASLRGKRKSRQATRMSHAKRRRKQRKSDAENYNNAVAKMDAERKEAEQAHADATRRYVERFEKLAKKDTLSNEEVQEVIEMFGSPEGAARMRELRAGDSFENRIMDAVAKAEKGQA